MRLLRLFAVFLTFLPVWKCAAGTAYFDDFSSPASIQDYTIYGEKFVGYNPPPLHTVTVTQGQLQITTSADYPNGAGNPPALSGSADLMRSNTDFQAGFKNVFSNDPGVVSWSFNVANQDGDFNNGFEFWLGSSTQDPTATGAVGYVLRGGGMVGNRMTVSRFGDAAGNLNPVIDLTNGLGTLPEMGSYKVTFDPATGRWSLFGVEGSQFVDPMSVAILLGTGVDTTYTHRALPYFGLGGENTGLDVFDNVGVAVVPEPASTALVIAIFCAGLALRRKRNWRVLGQ